MDDPLSNSFTKLKLTNSDAEVEKAFGIYTIYQNIFGRLELDDLKSCRLVNTTFYEISSDIIKSRDCCQVQLMYSEDSSGSGGTFFRSTRNKESQEIHREFHLAELNQMLNFPCTDFEISVSDKSKYTFKGTCRDDEISLNLRKFWNVHGNNIHTLKIYLPILPHPVEDLYKILYHQATSIRNLSFIGVKHWSFKYNLDEFKGPWLSLPKLERFVWDGYCEIVDKILDNAPNLTQVEFSSVDSWTWIHHDSLRRSMDAVIASGKMSAIKKLNYSIFPNDVLMKFVKANPQLEEIQYCSDVSKMLPMMEANANSLRYVNFSGITASHVTPPIPQFPRMPNLRKLSVGTSCACYRSTPTPCIPPRIYFLNTFPNLYCLDLSRCFPKPHALIGNLPTVKVLEVSTYVSIRSMKRIRRYLCPNFNNLVIHVNLKTAAEELPEVLRMIYIAWWHLESIEIRGLSIGICDLDFALTGLTICEDGSPMIRTPRIRSLGCLGKLKKLTFVFSELPEMPFTLLPETSVQKPFLFSEITCRFIQEHMQNLQHIIIQLDRHYKKLADMAMAISPFKIFQFVKFGPMTKGSPYS